MGVDRFQYHAASFEQGEQPYVKNLKCLERINISNYLKMDWITVLGLVAGACTSVAVVPQLTKAYRAKSVRDVSPGMFAVLIAGLTLWVTYGFLREDLAIIVTNAVALGLNGIMLLFMFRYRK